MVKYTLDTNKNTNQDSTSNNRFNDKSHKADLKRHENYSVIKKNQIGKNFQQRINQNH